MLKVRVFVWRFVLGLGLLVSLPPLLPAQDDAVIWREFVTLLKAGAFPPDRVRGYDPVPRDALVRSLESIHLQTDWSEWNALPDVFVRDNERHYVLPLTFGGRTRDFVFTLVVEDGHWYLRHLESILIRLDRLDSLPTRRFPALAESDKAWMRAEIETTERVRLFSSLVRERGRQAAFDWFRDGAGYALAARTWVPMFPLPDAFIRYLCWEQAELRGNAVTLERLDSAEAVVRIQPLYFQLFAQTGHLRTQISAADYRSLFDTVWQDRARHGGWRLEIGCGEDECLLRFTRPMPPASVR